MVLILYGMEWYGWQNLSMCQTIIVTTPNQIFFIFEIIFVKVIFVIWFVHDKYVSEIAYKNQQCIFIFEKVMYVWIQ
jgi:hypothetical protein